MARPMEPAAEPAPEPAPRGRLLALASFAAVAALTVVAYRDALGFQLLGHDSYSLIRTGRFEAPLGPLEAFGEEFLEGEFGVQYYRPVESLTFGLDHLLYGLGPRGYQLTNLLALVAAALAMLHLLRRALGPDGAVAALLAAVAYALYPTHWEVVPVVERRHDPLCLAFLALTLAAHLRPGARPSWRTGLLAFLAMGTKEVGVIVVPLALGAAFLWPRVTGVGPRAVDAVRRCAPDLVALATYLGLRVLTLGGVGSAAEGSLADVERMHTLLERALLPAPDLRETALAPLHLVAPVAALVLAAVALRGARGARGARAILLGLAWVAGCCLLMAYRGGGLKPWHLPMPAAGWTLALGGGLGVALAARRAPLVLGGALATLPAAAVAVAWTSYSPLVRDYPQWEVAATRAREYLDGLERQIEGAADGAVVRAPEVPMVAPRRAQGARIQNPAILSPRAVMSWVELRFEDRTIQVVGPFGADARRPDGVVVVLPSEPMVRSGEIGALRRLLDAMIAEDPPLGGRLKDVTARVSRGDAGAARGQLVEAVTSSPAATPERLHVLADHLEWLRDLPRAEEVRRRAK